jgi:hypothetical protein
VIGIRESENPLSPTEEAEKKLYYRSFGLDGILGQTKFLSRQKLVDKALFMLEKDRFLLITSPPATGKTSLIQLMYQTGFRYAYFGCLKDEDPYEYLKSVGVDLRAMNTPPIQTKFLVILDDAQNIYHHTNFWTKLIKQACVKCPNFKFIISVTHSLNIPNESPFEFQSIISQIRRSDLLLSDEEILDVFDMLDNSGSFSLKMYPLVCHVITKQSGGVVGAIVLSIRKIYDEFKYYKNPQESHILNYYYSNEFISESGRLFGADRNATIPQNLRLFLSQCYLIPTIKPKLHPNEEEKLNALVKGGVLLTGTVISFSYPLAKRFYLQKLFPSKTANAPANLRALIVSAIQNMSAKALEMSTITTDYFPKEACFQHQFMSGLLASLPINCHVCPELSKDFPDDDERISQNIDGEIDFYVNGNLRWGIELAVNGDHISEHLNRFIEPNGKFVKLRLKDYIVVDFRCTLDGLPTNVSLNDEKRVSVFFKHGDFVSCTCKFGLDIENTILDLSA